MNSAYEYLTEISCWHIKQQLNIYIRIALWKIKCKTDVFYIVKYVDIKNVQYPMMKLYYEKHLQSSLKKKLTMFKIWESLLLVAPFYFFINDPIVLKLGQGT